jgi:putative transposase
MAALFESAGKLNSMARQAMAQRAIFAIGRFFSNCKASSQGRRDIHNSRSRLVP